MLKKESIILNTSKQFQFAWRKPKLDVTDTQNQMFQSPSHWQIIKATFMFFESLYLGIISIS